VGHQSERLWPARLRWRMRGAWLWPAFFGLTVLDGVLIALLPPYDGAPQRVIGGVLLAGFANLALVAVVAPLAGRLVRRRRPDLPRVIANDYAGVGLVVALGVVVLAAGLAHRPAVAAENDDRAAVQEAVEGYVLARAPRFHAGLGQVDVLRLARDSYRACVPGPDPRRWLCLIVDTDQRPPGLVRDGSMEPNSALRTVGGFH
jgi:4-amino-4-deoxy-L-arabinose transferase-like glycosyltransferase